MNLEQLQYIVDLDKTGNFSKSAQNLHISQSGLSQGVNNLEEELGLVLFHRTRKKTEATLEGKKIIQKSKEILQNIHELRELSWDLSSEKQKPFRISVTNEIMAPFLESMLNFSEKYPDFEIEIDENKTIDIIKGVKNKQFDIGFVVLDKESYSLINDLTFKNIGQGKFYLYVWHTHYLYDHQDPISIDLFKEQEFVIFKDEYIYRFINKINQQFGHLNVTMRTNSFKTVLEYMKKFNAVTIVRDFQIENNLLNIPTEKFGKISLQNICAQNFQYGWITSKANKLTSKEHKLVTEIEQNFSNS